jgi:hypothetical protein
LQSFAFAEHVSFVLGQPELFAFAERVSLVFG